MEASLLQLPMAINQALFQIRPRDRLIRVKRYPGILRNIQQIIQHRLQQRNPFFTPNRFRFYFRIAGNQQADGFRGGLGVAENLDLFVDRFLEFVFVDEGINQEVSGWN